MDFQLHKYNEKVGLFQQVRRAAPALSRAATRQRQFVTWDAGTLDGTKEETERVIEGGKDIAGMANFFHVNYVGAMEYISQPRFRIGYHVYGDVEREPVLGENTASINYDICWEKLGVDVDLYTGNAYQVYPNERLSKIEQGGISYRDDIAKFTGWNRQDVQRLGDDQVRTLTTLLRTVVVGQNKFTRLVKGFLLMLACMEQADGRLHVDRDVQRHLLYSPQNVITAFNVPRRSYVWCSEPSSDQYVGVLLCMGEAYPPQCVGQSHVSVPADANEVYLVADGQNVNPHIDCLLTPQAIYSSVLRYASDVGVMDQVQGALTCAASLNENRYFSHIGLPKVVSTNDLLIPGLERPAGAGAAKPFITRNQGRALGRVHQMLSFMVSKDLISAAIMSTKNGFNPYETIRSYLSTQEQLVSQMGYMYSDIRLLEITSQMQYLSRLSQDDCDDIASLPIFEALWLCDGAKKGVQNGVLQMIKTGVKDNSDDTSTRDILIDEMWKGGLRDKLEQLPTGRFTTEGCAVESVKHWQLRKPRREFKTAERVFECSYKPTSYTPRRKARIGNGESNRPTRKVTVPINLAMSPDKREAKSDGADITPVTAKPVVSHTEVGSPPPSYSTGSKSSSFSRSPSVNSGDRHRRTSSVQSQSKPIPFLSRLAQSATGEDVKGDVEAKTVVRIENAVSTRLGLGTKPGELDDLRLSGDETLEEVANKYIMVKSGYHGFTESEVLGQEVLGMILSATGASAAEVDFAVEVAYAVNGAKALWNHVTVGRFVDWLESTGRATNLREVTVPPTMSGQYARLGRIVQKGRHTGPGQESVLNAMRQERRKWVGNIETAPRDGLRSIANSESWLNFLADRGVSQDRGMNMSISVALAVVYERNPTLSYDVIATVAEWIGGTSMDMVPAGMTTADVYGLGDPYELDYREGETSHEQKGMSREDSKYLVMASQIPKRIFETSTIKELKKMFTLDKGSLKIINDRYNLWPVR